MLQHPGGKDIIERVRAEDVTVLFDDVGHSSDARRCVRAFTIGRLEGATIHRQPDTSPLVKKMVVLKKKANDALNAGMAFSILMVILFILFFSI